MSAIFGIFHLDGKPIAPETLDDMKRPMEYWGLDGFGLWRDGPIGLGHLMRHTTPESVGEKLPLKSALGELAITADARLDNRDELFDALGISPPERDMFPDSRLILEAYRKWGEDCPRHLLGDWVFAIWDGCRRKLFLARTHHGSLGFYYYSNSRLFVFSSSLKGLFSLPGIPRHPNARYLAQILTVWLNSGSTTSYKDIFRIPPAHSMRVTSEGIETRCYWSLKDIPPIRYDSDREYVEAFLEIYTEAVRCRLRSTGPIGIMLSSGLDSGSIAALAAPALQAEGKSLRAFSSIPVYPLDGLVRPNKLGDESGLVETIRQYVGNIEITYIDAAEVSPITGIRRYLDLHNEPVHGVGNTYWITTLMETARNHGIGTLLTGLGGNATISWSASGRLASLARNGDWATLWGEIRATGKLNGRPLWRILGGQVIKPLIPAVLYHRYRMLRTGKPLWDQYSAINPELAHRLALAEHMRAAGHDPTFRLKPDVSGAQRTLLGTTWRANDMGGGGIPVRDPTLDRRVIEFCLGIPDDQYFQGGRDRLLIRRAMKGLLPLEVIWYLRRGLQAADIVRRIRAADEEVRNAYEAIKASDLARYYLNTSKMEAALSTVMNRVDYSSSECAAPMLLRGLMVGMFLLRFDKK